MGLTAKDLYLQGNTDIPVDKEQSVCPVWVFLLFESIVGANLLENVQRQWKRQYSLFPLTMCAENTPQTLFLLRSTSSP